MLSCWVKTCRQFSRVFSKIANNGNVASCPFTTFVEENLVLIHNEHPARGCSRHGLHSCTTKVENLLGENVRMFSKVNTQLQCYEGAVRKAIRRHPRASWVAHNRQFVAIRTDHRWLFNCLQKTLISNPVALCHWYSHNNTHFIKFHASLLLLRERAIAHQPRDSNLPRFRLFM